MLRHLADTQAALSAALRPLPVQREAGERKEVSGRDTDRPPRSEREPPKTPASAEQPVTPE
jgi:hypothetical protein